MLFVLTVSIEKGILTENLLSLLKPIKCGFCEERFPDQLTSERHVKKIHSKGQQEPSFKELVPATMNVNQLKVELRKHGKSTTGNKGELQRRLEGVLTK